MVGKSRHAVTRCFFGMFDLRCTLRSSSVAINEKGAPGELNCYRCDAVGSACAVNLADRAVPLYCNHHKCTFCVPFCKGAEFLASSVSTSRVSAYACGRPRMQSARTVSRFARIRLSTQGQQPFSSVSRRSRSAMAPLATEKWCVSKKLRRVAFRFALHNSASSCSLQSRRWFDIRVFHRNVVDVCRPAASAATAVFDRAPTAP